MARFTAFYVTQGELSKRSLVIIQKLRNRLVKVKDTESAMESVVNFGELLPSYSARWHEGNPALTNDQIRSLRRK